MPETTYLIVAGVRRPAGSACECRISAYAEIDEAKRAFQALRARHFGADDWGSLVAVEHPDGLKIVCWFGTCPSVRRGRAEADDIEIDQQRRRLRSKARAAWRKRRR